MSQLVHPSTLTDYSARTWVTDKAAFASQFNTEFKSLQSRVSRLNQAVKDVNSRHAGTSEPTSKQIGQLYYNTSEDRLYFDQDGLGADQTLPRVIYKSVTPVSGTVLSDPLITLSLPVNTLIANGKIVRITAWGTKSGTTGSNVIELTPGVAGELLVVKENADAWIYKILLIRTGSGAQDFITVGGSSDSGGWNGGSASTEGSFGVSAGTATLTDSSAITLWLNLGALTGTDTITQEGVIVELLN